MLKLSPGEKVARKISLRHENIKLHNMTLDLTLDAALLICQELHICLIANGCKLIIYHPGVVVPRRVTQVLRLNTQEVLRRIGQAHVSVCPSPELHKHTWLFTVKRDCCDLCARLNYYMDKKSEKDAA